METEAKRDRSRTAKDEVAEAELLSGVNSGAFFPAYKGPFADEGGFQAVKSRIFSAWGRPVKVSSRGGQRGSFLAAILDMK